MYIGKNGGGTKRSNPDGGEQGRVQQPAPRMRLDPQTPGSIHAKLISSFKQPPLAGTPLATLLSDLSQGRLPESLNDAENLIKDLLIQQDKDPPVQQEFAAFVETFNLLNDLKETQAQHVGEPFKRVLDLRLPSNWVLTDENGLAKTLPHLRVTRVEVSKPYSDPEQKASPRGTSAILGALLLAGKMIELGVNCALTKPDLLRYALANSQLASIELMVEDRGSSTLAREEKNTAAVLLDGLRSCSTLKHVSLGHWELAILHAGIEKWTNNTHAPKLESIDLWSRCGLPARHQKGPVDFEQIHLQFDAFMIAIASIKTLQELTVKVDHVSVNDLETQVLEPLIRHPSLRRLDINTSGDCLKTGAENTEAMLRVLRIAVTCPSLRHVAWRSGREDKESAEVYIGACVDLVRSAHPALSTHEILAQLAAAQALTALLTSENFRLESLVFHGLAFFTGLPKALSEALLSNRTLHHIDLFDCLMPFEALGAVLDALKHNPTITTGRLPDNYADYLVGGTREDPTLYGFMPISLDMDDEPVHDFVLQLGAEDDDEIDEFSRAQANAAFDPYRHLASRMFTTFYDRLAENRQRHITRSIHPVTRDFMASAHRGLTDPDIAQSVVTSLLRDGAWPTLVHLSEVNKATASHGIQDGALRQELMRQVRKERAAEWINSPARMAKEGFVDYALTYTAASSHLKHERFDAVRAELKRGQTDSDGSIAEQSFSASIREALRIAKETSPTPADAAREAKGDTDAEFQDG